MSIRSKVFQGGIYLALRQGLGTCIGLGGILILTRTIGPKNYGLFVTSIGLLAYLQAIAQWGVEIYLVRQQGKETEEVYHQAFTLLLLLGSGGTTLALLGLPLLERWVQIEGFSSIAKSLFLGLPITETVGYLALALKVVQTLSFVKDATWRLSIAALGRLQGDRTRLVKAIDEGMSLQAMALGPLLVGFGIVSPLLLPLLFGSQWLPMLKIYPFVALSYLINAVFNLHSSVLYVLQKNWEVTSFHLVHIILFGGAALLLVPRLGLEGYGWAEIIAFPSYILLHLWLIANVGKPIYTLATIWFIAFAIPLFGWKLGLWTWSFAVLPLVWSKTRIEFWKTISLVLSNDNFVK